MTPEERARALVVEHNPNTQLFFVESFIASAIRAAVAEEREACATVCDLREKGHWLAIESGHAHSSVPAAKKEAEKCAAAIRARADVTLEKP